MSNDPCYGPLPCRRGFTLIEVVAALVIFSGGVLMMLNLTTALSRQMNYAGTASELVIRSQERLDSLEALPFSSLALGTTTDTITIRGVQYVRTVMITEVTGLLYQLQVTLTRLDGGTGPTFTAISYAAAPW